MYQDANTIGFTQHQNGEIWIVDTQKKRLGEFDNDEVKMVKIVVPQQETLNGLKLFFEKRRLEAKVEEKSLRFLSPEKIMFEVKVG